MRFIRVTRAFLDEVVVLNAHYILDVTKDTGDNEGGSVVRLINGQSYRIKEDVTQFFVNLE